MISVFAMTSKGFEVVSSIIDSMGASFIDMVVGARDGNIEDDHYDQISGLCARHRVQFVDRKDQYEVKTDFSFAISWRWIIDLPVGRLIVFHDSLLPRYRGFAPLVNCLINGEKEIGVTALFASPEYDKGDIVCQERSTINYPLTIKQAIQINNENYTRACLYVCNLIHKKQSIQAQVQDEQKASYSLWRDEEDYLINWNDNAEKIKRLIDATGYPYKGAATFDEGRKIRIIEAEIVADLVIENRDPGKVITISDGKPVVVCGKGLLRITNAFYDDDKTPVLPLKRFRTRLR